MLLGCIGINDVNITYLNTGKIICAGRGGAEEDYKDTEKG